ncbi:MAG: bifunctional oligoribonuclease/PAP phosphatase NrnA [Clostridiales bacterium]|jgi:phosphoesterase RecJ-like protein|nr:bifunctional oligoribonuclease/PAP phosphatase NrnA [Clostridiales bacterium]
MNKINELLRGYQKIVIAGHVNPDGDAVGACFALAFCLKQAGKEPVVLLENYPARFDSLGGGVFVYSGDYAALDSLETAAFVAVDTSSKERLGRAEAVFDKAGLTIVIDHHISNPGYADYNLIDASASSASEIMFDVVKTIAPVSQNVAEYLFTGIIFDTGGFRNSAATPKTFRKTAELIETGIRFTEIFRRVMDMHTVQEAKIFGIALSNLVFDAESGIAYTTLSLEEMRSVDADFSDLDGIVNYLLNLKGADIAVLVSERAESIAKASLRSKELDVNKVAGTFGGGGHLRAAGATVSAPLAEALALVLSAVKKELNP